MGFGSKSVGVGALLANLNQQRLDGRLCDLSIHVRGRVFRAHRAVMAASSPYFHDQTVLGSAYTGRLSMAPEALVHLLTGPGDGRGADGGGTPLRPSDDGRGGTQLHPSGDVHGGTHLHPSGDVRG
uniref:BTB domain-containing protein n=1 Tax=Amazona collaria TaxID=241587 RepID=A0A8B9F3Y7_9PSIT